MYSNDPNPYTERTPHYAGPPPGPVRTGRKRFPTWAIVAIAASVVLLGGLLVGGIVISSQSTDPGIEFCENIRDEAGTEDASGESQPWAFEDYQTARETMEGSRYEEIRGPAVELVDLAWQIEQLGEDPGMEALPLVGQFMDVYSRLSGGCAQHGIQLPPMDALEG